MAAASAGAALACVVWSRSRHSATGAAKQRLQRLAKEEYDDAADRYDEQWSEYTTQTVNSFLERCGDLGGSQNILDIGCGTGALSFALATQCGPDAHVTGVDISEGMLRRASAKARQIGSNACSFVHGSAELLPLPDSSIDLAVSSSSFHFWGDTNAGLREIARVLKPGGTLLLLDWSDDFWACKLCSVYLWALGYPHSKVYSASEAELLCSEADFQISQPTDLFELELRAFENSVLRVLRLRWGCMLLHMRKPITLPVADARH